ncbi:hypothetical protein AGLY_001023 [Aphis glycines]|uniref:Uncharacterized protein n=1 Tax=Aphis glycines TaxID=307491 RepID=A0A6G0U9P6_APHGL|nr:hypothetical protein AGLY_001023 [Aphis glycines]
MIGILMSGIYILSVKPLLRNYRIASCAKKARKPVDRRYVFMEPRGSGPHGSPPRTVKNSNNPIMYYKPEIRTDNSITTNWKFVSSAVFDYPQKFKSRSTSAKLSRFITSKFLTMPNCSAQFMGGRKCNYDKLELVEVLKLFKTEILNAFGKVLTHYGTEYVFVLEKYQTSSIESKLIHKMMKMTMFRVLQVLQKIIMTMIKYVCY